MSKNRARRMLIGFLIILALCTYFSATFASLLAARVTLCIPSARVAEDGTFLSCIVPESALELEDQLYIAVEQEDFWGTILLAQPVRVKAMDLENGEVAILEGLAGHEKVIISWDRPLDINMRVIEE
ncbi:MAG: hypothetical protein Q4G52_05210 [Clostridia bacterium]|nr:hypothetical protein [Clostridia bacterium]